MEKNTLQGKAWLDKCYSDSRHMVDKWFADFNRSGTNTDDAERFGRLKEPATFEKSPQSCGPKTWRMKFNLPTTLKKGRQFIAIFMWPNRYVWTRKTKKRTHIEKKLLFTKTMHRVLHKWKRWQKCNRYTSNCFRTHRLRQICFPVTFTYSQSSQNCN